MGKSKSGFFKDWTDFKPTIRGFMVTRISTVYRATKRIPQVECLEWIEAKWNCSRYTAFYKLQAVIEEYPDLTKEKDPGFSNQARNTAFIKYTGRLEKRTYEDFKKEKDNEEWWKPKRRLFGLLPGKLKIP